jgi:hypothetical protein
MSYISFITTHTRVASLVVLPVSVSSSVSLGSPGFRRHRRAASSMSLLHTPRFIRETMAKVVVATFEQEVLIYGRKLRVRELEELEKI